MDAGGDRGHPRRIPELQIILGLSNVSFGLNPAARHVLNSVMLDHAMPRAHRGHRPQQQDRAAAQDPAEEVEAAEDLIFDRRADGHDPLQAFMALFADRKADRRREVRPETIEEQLKLRIVDGDKQGLEADLDTRWSATPLAIINDILLDGMKTVGELFGAGKMQLPFVLQSAETMKKAVAYLEPLMERVEGQEKGTIVLATVKGDVHDIGKNLVDIILTNNGYRVVNLGIKQPLTNILELPLPGTPSACPAPGQVDRDHAREPGGDAPSGLGAVLLRRRADLRAMSRTIAGRPMARARSPTPATPSTA